ncbi:hypothetical protein ES703_113203 [subsurface metagenome]
MIKSEKGFSLLEVLIALAVLGIIVIAVCYALATASKTLLVADVRGTAETLAIKQMEYIRNQDYSVDQWSYQVTSSEEPSAFPEPSWWDDPPSKLSENYARYLVVAEAFDDERDGIRKIIVSIYYNPDTGDPIITLECYKVRR